MRTLGIQSMVFKYCFPLKKKKNKKGFWYKMKSESSYIPQNKGALKEF